MIADDPEPTIDKKKILKYWAIALLIIGGLVFLRVGKNPVKIQRRLDIYHGQGLEHLKFSKLAENFGEIAPSKQRDFARKFMKKIKDREYEKSYRYLSEGYKTKINLEQHIDFMKLLTEEYGAMLGYTDKLPISTENRNTVLFAVKYSGRILIAQVKLTRQADSQRISEFTLSPLKELKDRELMNKIRDIKLSEMY